MNVPSLSTIPNLHEVGSRCGRSLPVTSSYETTCTSSAKSRSSVTFPCSAKSGLYHLVAVVPSTASLAGCLVHKVAWEQ